MPEEQELQEPNANGFVIMIEEGTKTQAQIVFFAVSGLTAWIFCTIFAWILSGYITRNRRRLSTILILATFGVILFAWSDGFISFIFSTNVFISDAKYVMNYECSQALHFSALSYGIYRYSLYLFFLIRIRHFFKGTAHEFRKQKFIAAFTIITIISFCLICVLVFYQTPTIVNSGKYRICSGELNDALREEILIFLLMDVFVSLYLTWLFVIKSRALLALENANKNALEDDADTADTEEDDNGEQQPLNNKYGVDHMNMPSTYFVDELNGGLRSKSVRRLMLRCIYFGMLAMMVTWIHLALRFINFINIRCVETLVNSFCVVLSYDITNGGYCTLFCWCHQSMGNKHGYGRNVRKKKKREIIVQEEKEEVNELNLSTVAAQNDLSSTDQSDLNQ